MRDLAFINHILESIEDIENSIGNVSKEKFENSPDIRDANIRRLEIIGEAVKKISDEIKNKNREVEWKKMAGTRDVMIHSYFNVDLDIVWNIIKEDLPKLKKQILNIKKEII